MWFAMRVQGHSYCATQARFRQVRDAIVHDAVRLKDYSIRTEKAYINGAAWAMSFRISSGSPLAGSRSSEMASCGQWETHTPQPMQAAASMWANPSSMEIAAN
jgi:hypothetical protein